MTAGPVHLKEGFLLQETQAALEVFNLRNGHENKREPLNSTEEPQGIGSEGQFLLGVLVQIGLHVLEPLEDGFVVLLEILLKRG
jgi:hypothetical protein